MEAEAGDEELSVEEAVELSYGEFKIEIAAHGGWVADHYTDNLQAWKHKKWKWLCDAAEGSN